MNSEKPDMQEQLLTMQERSRRLVDELRTQLSNAQETYRQLGQRASALASERDAVRTELQDAKQTVESVRSELGVVQEKREELESDYQVKLEAKQEAQEVLRQKLEELTTQYEQNLEQQAQLEQQIETLQSSGQKSLAREKKLIAELDMVKQNLAVAEQHNTAADDEKQNVVAELESVRQEFDNTCNAQREQISALEQRVKDLETERDAADQEVTEFEASLLEASSRQVEILEHALQQARDAAVEIETAAEGV